MYTVIKLLVILLSCFSTLIAYAACSVSKDRMGEVMQEKTEDQTES